MTVVDQQDSFSRVFKHLEQVEGFAITLGIGLFVLLILFSMSVGLSSNTQAEGFALAVRAFSVSAATVFAAGAIGALLGFLFGIPRLLQRPVAPQLQFAEEPSSGSTPQPGQRQTAHDRFFTTNTSFEEISDWLTKIIIGLGLVQFQTILQYLYTASLVSASYINNSPVSMGSAPVGAIAIIDGKIATTVTFSLIVTSLLCACLITYLETRTRLAVLFTHMEEAAGRAKAMLDAGTRAIADRDLATRAASASDPRDPTKKPATSVDLEVTAVPFSGLRSPLELVAWGSAQARTGNLDNALTAFRKATADDPSNAETWLRLGQVLRLRGNIREYIEALLKAAERDPANLNIASEARAAVLDALYLPSPSGYEYVLRLGSYLEGTSLAADPRIWMYIAAARGQEFKYKSKPDYKSGDQLSPELSEIRQKTLDAILQVARLQPDPRGSERKTLRNMYLPGSDVDDDLRIFYRDKEFDEAIGITNEP